MDLNRSIANGSRDVAYDFYPFVIYYELVLNLRINPCIRLVREKLDKLKSV